MILYLASLACIAALTLIFGLHYLQELGQPDKACRKRESPPQPIPREVRRQFKVIVIGGSTAGLTMASRLEQICPDYVVLEEHESCGTHWRQYHDRLHLRTIKEVSGLPGLPLPTFWPVYPSKDQMANYYDGCSRLFNVRANTTVISAHYDTEQQQWTVRTRPTISTNKTPVVGQSLSTPMLSSSSEEPQERVDIGDPQVEVYTSKALVVCTGATTIPNLPDIPGRDKFSGPVIHASEYKNGRDFAQKKVLVVGADTTGAEIAMDLWEHEARVGLLAPSPVVIVRRATLRPFLLFYPLARLIPNVLRRRMYDFLAPMILGKLSDLNLQLPPLSKHRKTDPIPPVWVDIGTLDLVRQHEITIFNKDISTFIPNGVIFKDGKEEVFDAVILNTGYKKASYEPFLEPEGTKLGKEPVTITKAFRPDLGLQDGVEIEKKGLYFVGFSDAFFKLKEDHYACERVCRDLMIKKYV